MAEKKSKSCNSKTELRVKKEKERKIFGFTSLRVWAEIFPAVLELEDELKGKENNDSVRKTFESAGNAVEELVKGYYKFHLVEKYLSYNRAREQASVTLFLIYRLGFLKVMERDKVLEFGERFQESIKMINSLIKNLENKIRRMDETKFIMGKIREQS